jgi:DNA-binding SARP family transcriptional activator
VEAGEYHLDAARFSIDVDEFDAALANARAISNDETVARWLEQAIVLYQGEYLGNLYYDWLFPERRRLSQEYLAALRQLADYHFTHERYTRSLDLLHRALRMDNLLEELHCQVMRVYAALGDRAGLMHQYLELSDVLASEMGIEPIGGDRRVSIKGVAMTFPTIRGSNFLRQHLILPRDFLGNLEGVNILSIQNAQKNLINPKVIPKKFYG